MVRVGEFSKPTVSIIWSRDQGMCAWCGLPVFGSRGLDWSVHHREPRGSGGRGKRGSYVELASNGVIVHGHGTSGCHSEIERFRVKAIESGFLVSRIGQRRPNSVPIRHALFGWVHLRDDGTWQAYEDERE